MTRLDRVRNVDVKEALKQEEIMEKVKHKQRAWKKLEQMGDTRQVRTVYTEQVAGKRPRKKWKDCF